MLTNEYKKIYINIGNDFIGLSDNEVFDEAISD